MPYHSDVHPELSYDGRPTDCNYDPVAMGRPHRVNQWFYISVALLLILFNVIAFAPSIIDRSERNVPLPLTPLVSVHAVLSVVWLLIFLMQTILVATGRTVIHRRVGIIGALVTVAGVKEMLCLIRNKTCVG